MIRSERIGKGRLKFYRDRDIEIKEKYYGGEISGRRIHVANNVPLSIQLTNRVRGTFRFSMLRKLSSSLESGRFRTKKNSQYQILHNGQCTPQLSQLFNSLENVSHYIESYNNIEQTTRLSLKTKITCLISYK